MLNYLLNRASSIFLILVLMSIPMKSQQVNTTGIQIKLMVKVMSMDKNFHLKENRNKVRIGILFSGISRTSVNVKDEVLYNIKKTHLIIHNNDIEFVLLDLNKYDNTEGMIIKNDLDGLFITPLRGYDINIITQICRNEKVVSFTNEKKFLDNGVSVTFDRMENKTKIFINIDSAKAEGVNFSSNLLKITEIVSNKSF